MFVAWLEDEDPTTGDGHLWNAPTAKDAAEMHVDDVVIPHWGQLGQPRQVVVHVQEHEDDATLQVFVFDIDLQPVRGFGKVRSGT